MFCRMWIGVIMSGLQGNKTIECNDQVYFSSGPSPQGEGMG